LHEPTLFSGCDRAVTPTARVVCRSLNFGLRKGIGVDDKDIIGHIAELVRTEHELRDKLAAGTLSESQERAQLDAAEEALDQCWDLLRQRRARREFGEDPGGSAVRPVSEVEGYLQ
jgi:hypothetical protein